jgi:hypothetical protein
LHHVKGQFAQEGIDDHVVSHGREMIQWLLSLRMSGLFWVLNQSKMQDPILEPKRQGTAAYGVWETSTINDAGDLYVYSSVFDLFLQKHPSPRRRTDLIRGWIDSGVIEPGPGYVPGAPLRNAQISKHVVAGVRDGGRTRPNIQRQANRVRTVRNAAGHSNRRSAGVVVE